VKDFVVVIGVMLLAGGFWAMMAVIIMTVRPALTRLGRRALVAIEESRWLRGRLGGPR
jgi:hypothetical protein